MPLLYAYQQDLPAVVGPLSQDLLFSAVCNPALPDLRLPIPRACLLAECGCAWQGGVGPGSAIVNVMVNGIPVQTFAPAGGTNFVTANPAVPLAPGDVVDFFLTYDATFNPTNIQISAVIRPVGGGATVARLQMGVNPDAGNMLQVFGGEDHYEILDSGIVLQTINGPPFTTGILVPVAATVIRLVGQYVGANTLDSNSKLDLWDVSAQAPITTVTWGAAQTGLQDSGVIAIGLAPPTIATFRGAYLGATVGAVAAPISGTALLEIP